MALSFGEYADYIKGWEAKMLSECNLEIRSSRALSIKSKTYVFGISNFSLPHKS